MSTCCCFCGMDHNDQHMYLFGSCDLLPRRMELVSCKVWSLCACNKGFCLLDYNHSSRLKGSRDYFVHCVSSCAFSCVVHLFAIVASERWVSPPLGFRCVFFLTDFATTLDWARKLFSSNWRHCPDIYP